MNTKALFTFQTVVFTALVSYSVGAFAQKADNPTDVTGTAAEPAAAAYPPRQTDCQGAYSALQSANSEMQQVLNQNLQNQSQTIQQNAAAQKSQIQVVAMQEQAADQLQKAMSDINLQLQNQMDAAGTAMRKAIADIRMQIDAQDQKLIDANKELQAAELAVQSAITGQEAGCRAAADAARVAKQAAIDAKTQSDIQNHVTYNYTATTLAASKQNRSNKRLMDIQIAYVTSYKNCMAGVDGTGSGLAKAIIDANAALAKARDNNKAQIAMINKQTASLRQNLADLDLDEKGQLATITRNAQIAQNSAQSAYNTAMSNAKMTSQQASIDQQTASAIAGLGQQVGQQTFQMAQGSQSAAWSLIGAYCPKNGSYVPDQATEMKASTSTARTPASAVATKPAN